MRHNGPVKLDRLDRVVLPVIAALCVVIALVLARGNMTASRARAPRITWLAPAQGVGDLYLYELESSALRRLTHEPAGIFDFAVSPDGARVAYSASRAGDRARDLWLLDIASGARTALLRCDAQECRAPAWSPDGTRIVFERRALERRAIGVLAGPARLWQIDVATGQSLALFADEQKLAANPLWAPRGDKLAYVEPSGGVVVLDMRTQALTALPSTLGDPGAWSPDGNQLIYPDALIGDGGGSSRMLRADIAGGMLTTVFPISTSSNSSVAWAPAGDLIAFTRQQSGPNSGIGPQIWISRPDGGEARALTHAPEAGYFNLKWSADARWILAQRVNASDAGVRPQIWLIAADGGAGRKLADDATQAAWAP